MGKQQDITTKENNGQQKDSLKRLWSILEMIIVVVYILGLILISEREVKDLFSTISLASFVLLSLLYTVISLVKKQKLDWGIPISSIIILIFLIMGIIDSYYI